MANRGLSPIDLIIRDVAELDNPPPHCPLVLQGACPGDAGDWPNDTLIVSERELRIILERHWLKLRKGEIVQLGPNAANPMFSHCLMIVTEPKAWGAQGFVPALGSDGKPGGRAYYRAQTEEMFRTGGMAPWMPQDEEDADG